MSYPTVTGMMARFSLNDWKETLIDLYQQKLAEFGLVGVTVDRVYPRTSPGQDTQAIICVQRTSVKEEPAGIGRVLGESVAAGAEVLTEGAWQLEEVEVTIWALNGDLRDLLYMFCRGVVFAETLDLLRYGFRDVLLTHSSDDEIEDQLITDTYWYRNTCVFQCRTEIGIQTSADLATDVLDTPVVLATLPPVADPSPFTYVENLDP